MAVAWAVNPAPVALVAVLRKDYDSQHWGSLQADFGPEQQLEPAEQVQSVAEPVADSCTMPVSSSYQTDWSSAADSCVAHFAGIEVADSSAVHFPEVEVAGSFAVRFVEIGLVVYSAVDSAGTEVVNFAMRSQLGSAS